MKIVGILPAVLIAIALPQTLLAQGAAAKNADMVFQITEKHKANAALMRQYAWSTRMELIDQGAVKDIRIEMANYRPDGQLQYILLNDQGAPLPRGFLRRAMAGQEREKMEGYLTGLRGLLDQYTLPTAGKVLEFMNRAAITKPDPASFVQMTGRGVILPGDTLSIWTNTATCQTSRIEVTTFYQGDVVEVTATFKLLPSGLSYMAFAEVIIPARQLSGQVQNFNYILNAPPPPVQKVEAVPAPGQPAAQASNGGTSLQTIERKLRDLKALLGQGLITQSDYNAKKAQILQNL